MFSFSGVVSFVMRALLSYALGPCNPSAGNGGFPRPGSSVLVRPCHVARLPSAAAGRIRRAERPPNVPRPAAHDERRHAERADVLERVARDDEEVRAPPRGDRP